MSEFVKSSDRIKNIKQAGDSVSPLSFGNIFVDAATGGIFEDDCIVVTARTGGGKTEFVSQVAQSNALAGKNVHFFALEAFKNEIETRILFRCLSQAFFLQQDWREYGEVPNYQDWIQGKQSRLLAKFEPEVRETFSQKYKTLFTYYRDSNFDVGTFLHQLTKIWKETDLIVIDHLHYFDFESDNENSALKKTVKSIRTAAANVGRPVILVVQLRKQDRRVSTQVPDLEEIHGSSDIAKIATRIIATAPARKETQSKAHVFPTYFKLLKNRFDGSRCRVTGVCGFDVQRNCYSENFVIGEFDRDDSFVAYDQMNYPQWARRVL